MDPEMREAFDRLGADLRGEIRSSLDERFEAHTASLLHEMRESESRMRRHFEVVGESLRADNRSVAEGTALLSQRTDRRVDEQAGRADGLEGRVLRLEVRVSGLEDGRKPRQPRRRR